MVKREKMLIIKIIIYIEYNKCRTEQYVNQQINKFCKFITCDFLMTKSLILVFLRHHHFYYSCKPRVQNVSWQNFSLQIQYEGSVNVKFISLRGVSVCVAAMCASICAAIDSLRCLWSSAISWRLVQRLAFSPKKIIIII